MADPIDMPDLVERFRRVRVQAGGGGQGPTDSDIDHRVTTLEKTVDKIGGKLDGIFDALHDFRLDTEQRFGAATASNEQRFASIAERLASIEGKLDAKAAAIELAEIKGRVNSLPTTWQMAFLIVGTVVSILGGAFLILKFGLPHVP